MDQAAEDNWFAKSAVEMACWDIRGKELGQPVYALLGGLVRPRGIRCRFSMGAYEPDRARRRAAELIEAGFDTIKVKVGTNVDADIERVRVVRETIGPQPAIVIDANGGYDAERPSPWPAKSTTAACPSSSSRRLAAISRRLAEVRQAIRPEVMADDICFDLADAVECIRHRRMRRDQRLPRQERRHRQVEAIIDYAAAHGVACSIGSNLELDVASAAMCHLVVALPEHECREISRATSWAPTIMRFSIVKEPLEIRGPVITAPTAPAWVVEVDWKLWKRQDEVMTQKSGSARARALFHSFLHPSVFILQKAHPMASKRKSWQEKLADSKDLPKVGPIAGK